MTVETLHDALGQLPADLVTAADKARSHPRKAPVRWMRPASLAACLAVLLLGGLTLKTLLFSPMGRSGDCCASDTSTLAAAQPQEECAAEITGQSGTGAQDYSDLDTIALTPTGVPGDQKVNAGTESTAACVLSLADTQYVLTPPATGSAANAAGTQTVLIQSREALERYYEDNNLLFDLTSFYDSFQRYDADWFADHDLLLLRLDSDSGVRYQVTGFEALAQCEPPTWELTLTASSTSDSGACWHILMEAEKSSVQPDHVILVQTEEESS